MCLSETRSHFPQFVNAFAEPKEVLHESRDCVTTLLCRHPAWQVKQYGGRAKQKCAMNQRLSRFSVMTVITGFDT